MLAGSVLFPAKTSGASRFGPPRYTESKNASASTETARHRAFLARPAGRPPQRSSPARHGVGNQPSAGCGNRVFAPATGSYAARGTLGPEAHSGRRCDPHYASNGQSDTHLEAGGAGTGAGLG